MNYLPAIEKFLSENPNLPSGHRDILRQVYSHPLIVNQYLLVHPMQDIFRDIPVLKLGNPLYLERGAVFKEFNSIKHRGGYIHPDTYKVLQETMRAFSQIYLPYTENDELLVLALNYIVPTMCPPTPILEQKVNHIISIRHLSPKMDSSYLEQALPKHKAEEHLVTHQGKTFISWNALEHLTSNIAHQHYPHNNSVIFGNLWEEF